MSNSIGNLKNSGLQGNNFPWQLKMLQGLQAIYDEVKLPLTCAEDGVTICGPADGLDVNLHDGEGNPITSTPIGPDRGIDVNIIGGVTLEVNLDPDNDSVGMYGYTDINDPNSYTALLVNANGQLDIRPLTCLDQVTVCNTSFNNSSGNSSLNVHVTNQIPLEVNINEANDSILIYGNDGAVNRKIKTDAAGELQVDVLTMPATFAEDTPHVSGNTGAFVLGVRNDLNTAMTNANGDYSPIAVNDKGAVAIQDGGGSLTVDAVDLDIRNLTCADQITLCNGGLPVDATNPLPVNAIVTVPNLTCQFDSVAICDFASGNSLVPNTNGSVSSQTLDGTGTAITSSSFPLTSQQALDVNVVNNLDCSTDTVAICNGSGNALAIDTSGALNTNMYAYDLVSLAPEFLTSTGSGTSQALDVNIVTPNLAVSLGSQVVPAGVTGDLSAFGPNITSITFQNIGTAVATISVDGGSNFFPVAPGTVINLDPRVPMGYYNGTSFYWDTTTVGASLLIIYNYI